MSRRSSVSPTGAGVDVALPEIRRLEHVHVAVGDPLSVVRHRAGE
jgi:hypothetical protein